MVHTSPRSAILFDLGNTLAAYYRPAQFGPILEGCVRAVLEELRRRGIGTVDFDTAIDRARQENKEAPDFRFTPMEDRLVRIFGLGSLSDAGTVRTLCERFLEPIFRMGRVYDDALPVLARLRATGYATAIVSNAPWGSPPQLWHEELTRLGLSGAVDKVVMCGDVGWRKPAPQIFLHAAAELGVTCERCVFVGDELQWDVVGSASAGMRSILIDRDDVHPDYAGLRVRHLSEIENSLGAMDPNAYMSLALAEGRRALPACLPNPPVGCVLIRAGEIVARGFTQPPGMDHAEAMALRHVTGPLGDVTAYVTLEPCAFHGRTPSCAAALIERRIGSVVVAALDPDPRNAGNGVQMLQAAGVHVEVGLLKHEALRDMGPYLAGA
jgi:HAD superfamily hydrolase (TIGR01509 family)